MKQRKGLRLVRYFLRDSPQNQLKKFKTVFQQPHTQLQLGVTPLSNRSYLTGFLKSIQVFNYNPHQYRKQIPDNTVNIRSILKQQRMNFRPQQSGQTEVQQLLICIKQMTSGSSMGVTNYHQLQQRIAIAEVQTIVLLRQRLKYLFKILLNKRDKLTPQSIQLQANLNLSEVIVKAFEKNQNFKQNNKDLKELVALDKLMRAKQYKKKGYHSIAINSFEEVFKNQAAAYNVRLQALKVLCNEGEESGDVSKLEPLMIFTHEKGQKQYQQYIKIIIAKIKGTQLQKSTQN